MSRLHPADPQCPLCDGLGIRHTQRKGHKGRFDVSRDTCPCRIIGPLMPPGMHEALEALEAQKREQLIGFAAEVAKTDPADALAHLPIFPRPLSELDTTALDAYPDCQPRTPIDPTAKILSGGVMKGNNDLPPSVQGQLSAKRDCSLCGGRGALRGVVCKGCKGVGQVPR